MRQLLLLLLLPLLCTGCYYARPSDGMQDVGDHNGKVDSIAFYNAHHYWKDYNFVAVDTFYIRPIMPTDSATSESILNSLSVVQDSNFVEKGMHLVIADIRISKAVAEDSIWLRVATEEAQMGWVLESTLLHKSVPDNSISKFIYNFSQNSVLFILTLCIIGGGVILSKVYRKRRFQMVHFNDIDSFYPTALCLMVSFSAALYGMMQGAVPHTWVEFYFHPTLNPFAPQLPVVLRLFLLSFWGVLILGVATLEEFYRRPEMRHRATYLGALMGICAILYVTFTLSMRFYIGYPLLLAYWAFAWQRYKHYRRPHLRCGHCGTSLPKLGPCPHCGAINE